MAIETWDTWEASQHDGCKAAAAMKFKNGYALSNLVMLIAPVNKYVCKSPNEHEEIMWK